MYMGVRTIFQSGEQKLNKFSVLEAKIGEKQDNQILMLMSIFFHEIQ